MRDRVEVFLHAFLLENHVLYKKISGGLKSILIKSLDCRTPRPSENEEMSTAFSNFDNFLKLSLSFFGRGSFCFVLNLAMTYFFFFFIFVFNVVALTASLSRY